MNPKAARRSAGGILAAAALALGGCASAPLEEMARARDAVAAAQLAARAAEAPAELVRARGKLALAGRWNDARDYGPARWLAEQAEIDAELALARIAAEEASRAAALPPPPRTVARKVSLPAL
jgi:uncharacterized protein DUF4398